jgi:hypothetical protein
MACRQRHKLFAPAVEERIGTHDEPAGMLLDEGFEPGIDLAFAVDLQDLCGVAAVRENCVIGCRATPAEPFERSGTDEPFATSMTQLPLDQLQTFSVLPYRRKRSSVRGISAA